MKYNACQGCGIAVELPREPVIINSEIISLIGYEDETCEVCGHQKSGWTLSSLKQYHSNIYKNTVKSVFKEFTLQSHPFAHFAVFPTKIPEFCIKAGSSENDIILDPFSGSGTTCLVAHRLGRKYIGIEIVPEYIKIAEQRLKPYISQVKL